MLTPLHTGTLKFPCLPMVIDPSITAFTVDSKPLPNEEMDMGGLQITATCQKPCCSSNMVFGKGTQLPSYVIKISTGLEANISLQPGLHWVIQEIIKLKMGTFYLTTSKCVSLFLGYAPAVIITRLEFAVTR